MSDYKRIEKRKRLIWIILVVVVIGIFAARQLIRQQNTERKATEIENLQIAVIGDSFVEICLGLGLRERIVAVSYHGKEIPELKGIPHLGGPANFSEEQLLITEPNLIISSNSFATSTNGFRN